MGKGEDESSSRFGDPCTCHKISGVPELYCLR